MIRTLCHAWLPALVAWLALAGPVAALTSTVRDEAGLLKPATVAKADRQLREIERRYQCSVLVETFAAFPVEKAKLIPLPGLRTPSDEAISKWARERAQAAGSCDVYLLICREPLRVRVVVCAAAEEKFSVEDGRVLRDRIERDLEKKKDFDAALLAGVTYLRGALDAKVHPAASQSFGWVWILGSIVGILGLWLAVGLVRSKLDKRGPGQAGPFLPTLFGGMFGMAAGHWIYESLFGNRAAPPAEPHPEPVIASEAPGGDEETVQDPDYASAEDGHRGDF